MPRIRNTASDPIDFCRRCFPSDVDAMKEFGDVSKTGEGPDGRGNCYTFDDEHPPYDGEGYKCYRCKKALTGLDDYLPEWNEPEERTFGARVDR